MPWMISCVALKLNVCLTKIAELILLAPIAECHHDTSGTGCGAIWFLVPTATMHQGFTQTPILWCLCWPKHISVPWCQTEILSAPSPILTSNWLAVFCTWIVLHSVFVFMSVPFSAKATTSLPPSGSEKPAHPPTLPLPTSYGCLDSINESTNMPPDLITSQTDPMCLQMLFCTMCPYHGMAFSSSISSFLPQPTTIQVWTPSQTIVSSKKMCYNANSRCRSLFW